MAEPAQQALGFGREPYGWATFSACERYRYALARVLGGGPRWLWILLNPSKAGADFNDNDPTARKVIGFSRRHGVGVSVIVNPNALIETSPKKVAAMRRAGVDICGPDNERIIREQIGLADRIIVGWGGNVDPRDRDRMLALLAGRPLWSFGVTQDGEPRHPLMLAYATPLTEWPPPCPTCDGTATVSMGQHSGHPLTGGGGTPREAPCPECRAEERARWDEGGPVRW